MSASPRAVPTATGTPFLPADHPLADHPVAGPAMGRHRRSAARRIGRLLDAVSRLGSVVSLAALVVVAVAAGGVADGVAPDTGSAVSVTVEDADGAGR